MIITKTPFRMSFFGGGTDLPSFFKENGGAVISTTFDKFCYVTVRHLPQFFEYKTHLTYSQMEYINDASEIKHPLIRNAMQMLDMHELRLTYESDLPARTGLGTSSAFAVGMLNAFYCLKGKYASKQKLADESIYLERVLCNESGGWQDQIAAAYGGLNRIDFSGDNYQVRPIIIAPERKKELNSNLMLFFTGFTRYSSEIQSATEMTIKEKQKELREMLQLVDEAEHVLVDRDVNIHEFGKLLDFTWKLKRQTGSKISTDTIDIIYEKGMNAGALGGKLLGAGGGGFILFYVEPDKQDSVREALNELMYVPFCFEDAGTQVVHYSPEMYMQKGNK